MGQGTELDGDRGIVTFANGSPVYIELARALARSLQRFMPTMPRALVTDSNAPDLFNLFSAVIPVDLALGTDVTQKLFIDTYSPYSRTLFIDCDCIVVDDLAWVFDALSGGSTIVPNGTIILGADHPKPGVNFEILQRELGIASIREFNGGVYYVERGTISEQTFVRARELLQDYRRWGFSDYRASGPPDELVLGCAMEELQNAVVCTDRPVVQSPIGSADKVFMNVAKGNAKVIKVGWGTFESAVVHFGFAWKDHAVYVRERRKLQLLASNLPGREILAVAYSHWIDLEFAAKALIQRIWPHVPRPIRLAFHGVRTRLCSFTQTPGE